MEETARTQSVMIIDDDPMVVKGLIDHVPWGELRLHVAGTAANGEEALGLVRSNPPDILITDIYMPKMDGLELIRILREQFPSIYIIIHSGYDDFGNARQAMRYGVQHFILKPATIGEIESILREIILDTEVKAKQEKLQEQYRLRMKEHLSLMKEAFLKEMLTTRYKRSNIPHEKLAMLQLPPHVNVIVATVALIRPPYLTKSKERDWQLFKFGAGNIIRETASREDAGSQADIHVVDYSDTNFVLVFFARQHGQDLTEIGRSLTQRMVDNILMYLKLSLSVGIGGEKIGIHQIIDSYLESQRALEATEFREINRVFTFEEVHGSEPSSRYDYPLDLLKEIHDAIHQKEYESLLDIWDRFETDFVKAQRVPLFVVQSICIGTLSAFMMEHGSISPFKEEARTMPDLVSQIYSLPTVQDLIQWMKQRLEMWLMLVREELTSKKSHRLVREVQEYVHNYYDQEIILASIAEELFVNPNYLSQLFKKVTGETFVTYLNKYRIEKAKERLKERHYMIYEVSEMVGYQNPTYFSQVFKSITGVSPSEYYKVTES